MPPRKKVAAVVTEFRWHSHADLIVGKILEGYHHDGREFPSIELASLYVDQLPPDDMSRGLAKKHGFRLCDRIEDAITLGGSGVNVDGVLLIGEHGRYPRNAAGQILYPRRRFFEETTDVFVRHRKVVPVFTDKHLAVPWSDAAWMYERAKQLSIPLLAGSSIPVTWRRPELVLPQGVDLAEAVMVGYGSEEAYTFHALEGLQCMVERRGHGEVGVASVQALNGSDIWHAMDWGQFSRYLFEAGLMLAPLYARDDYRRAMRKARNPEAYAILIEYRDGFRAAVVMANGWAHEGDGGSFIFSGQIRYQKEPSVTQFYLQQPDPFGHFAWLLKAFETTVATGQPPYPVERTLLTTGILDAAMWSRHEMGRRIETPHLNIRYRPSDYAPAVEPAPPILRRPKPN